MNITFAIPHSGCSYWRCRQPAEMIQKQGLADVKIFDDMVMTDLELHELLVWADVIVRQSGMGIEEVVAMRKHKEMGKTVVGDYDDFTFALSPFNPVYRTYGLEEIKVTTKEGKEHWLYKNGENGFDIKENYFRFKSFQDLLKEYDIITTTNSHLKKKYSEFSKDIVILPNSIDFNLYKPFDKFKNDRIRIGWTASDSHYSEIWMVKNIMRRVINKYGDKVVFVELGNLLELQNEFTPKEMELHPWVGINLYPVKLASLNLDLAICPLEVNDPKSVEFNRSKSQLKWTEWGALRVPCVCTDAEPYNCVEDGVTGMLAKNNDEFVDKIGQLVENADLRKKMGDNAYDKNFKDFNLEKNACLWVEAYEQAREKSFDLPLVDEGDLQEVEK